MTSLVSLLTQITKKHELFFWTFFLLLFALSIAMTITECIQMSAMGEMPMVGDWTMSMMWMLMPGQAWVEAALSFTKMWTLMMVAMMLPALFPRLCAFRQNIRDQQSAKVVSDFRIDFFTFLVAIGYFLIWMLVGVLIFIAGFKLADITMKSSAIAKAVPLLTGISVIVAGLFQFTRWKLRQLNCCTVICPQNDSAPQKTISALGYGLRLGFNCNCCCAGLTIVLLMLGAMNFFAMVMVAAAITFERLSPNTRTSARSVGFILVVFGVYLSLQALVFHV